jgi:hypothetical protein
MMSEEFLMTSENPDPFGWVVEDGRGDCAAPPEAMHAMFSSRKLTDARGIGHFVWGGRRYMTMQYRKPMTPEWSDPKLPDFFIVKAGPPKLTLN